MKTNTAKANAEQIELAGNQFADLQASYEYKEPENTMTHCGSTQVLGDFLEFSDYLMPTNRFKRINKCSRQTIADDYYSDILCS
ncbi:MAG: hypothetical protein WCR72_06345 [Bacteroidota bacterium]